MHVAWLAVLCSVAAVAQAPPHDVVDASAAFRIALGGDATVHDGSPNAFSFPAPQLSAVERRAFLVGNSFFKQNWVVAPASTAGRDGLGPLFNARSCSSCHLRDGRSAPPEPDDADRQGLLLRIGVPAPRGPDRPHPIYGGQIQDAAILGVEPEARVEITCTTARGEYGDGTPFELSVPRYTLGEPAYGPVGSEAVLSPRTAPQLIGLGLLEAIPVTHLRALADPDDTNGDGVSGRVHEFVEGEARQVGRFGWKAGQPTVLAQTAAAFVNDIGITSHVFPDEALTPVERERIRAAASASPEIADKTLQQVVFYTLALAVPAQRDPADAAVVAGRAAFVTLGCAACHVETATTGDEAFHPGYRRQTFAPFTDLLLHDMGPGLADGKRDGDAGPSEWRTPPLWGIGLVPTVNGHSRYLHDGRARNLAEAVLWHGGEGQAAKERFRLAPATARAQLLRFLESL